MTIRELSIGTVCRCRVWGDEVPEITLSQENSETRSVAGPDLTAGRPFLAAMEIFIPRGARIVYGALMAEYTPDAMKSRVEIEVFIKDEINCRWPDSLAKSLDEVYVGLPSEYVEAIFSGACKAVVQPDCRLSGRIRFCGGAHGIVSSSCNVFEALAYGMIAARGNMARMTDVDSLRKVFF